MKQYAIQFSSLKPGSYTFKLEVNDKFFENFDESEIKKGRLNVRVDLQKQSRMLDLYFTITGTVNLMCDRCLDYFDFTIETETRLIIKFGTEKSEESDEIITIPESNHEINVAQYIYEYIHLALPTKRVHPDDGHGVSLCNKEILKKLEEHKSKEIETDPRWDILKKIKPN